MFSIYLIVMPKLGIFLRLYRVPYNDVWILNTEQTKMPDECCDMLQPERGKQLSILYSSPGTNEKIYK